MADPGTDGLDANEILTVVGATWSESKVRDALKAGKEGSKPAVILFMDAGAKSKSFGEALGDKELDEVFGKVAYAAVLFEKGSDEAKCAATSVSSCAMVRA